ncbi:hypothetical protein ACWY4P_47270 [Streptomyces sp. LZ34]
MSSSVISLGASHPERDQLVGVVRQHLRSELPEVWKYEVVAELAPVALPGHIAARVDLLERGLDTTEARAPPAARTQGVSTAMA